MGVQNNGIHFYSVDSASLAFAIIEGFIMHALLRSDWQATSISKMLIDMSDGVLQWLPKWERLGNTGGLSLEWLF